MARSIEEELAYRKDVLNMMERWNLPEAEYPKGQDWYDTVMFGSYFATGLKFPFVLNGVSGMLLAVSTPESNRLYQQNDADIKAGLVITQPYWLKYNVFFYKGLALGNWAGIKDPLYQEKQLPGDFECFLNRVFMSPWLVKPGPRWKSVYCMVSGGIAGGDFLASLRQLLVSLGIRTWLELTCGYSKSRYRCLDMYVRFFANGVPPPTEEAWYILNLEVPILARWKPVPELWMTYKCWWSMGQKQTCSQWDLQGVGQMQRMNPFAV